MSMHDRDWYKNRENKDNDRYKHKNYNKPMTSLTTWAILVLIIATLIHYTFFGR